MAYQLKQLAPGLSLYAAICGSEKSAGAGERLSGTVDYDVAYRPLARSGMDVYDIWFLSRGALVGVPRHEDQIANSSLV